MIRWWRLMKIRGNSIDDIRSRGLKNHRERTLSRSGEKHGGARNTVCKRDV